MREKRITAILMSLFMVISLLPATVFAAAPVSLEGQLKIKGAAAAGTTLSADLKEVKPEGLSEDSISYVWSRKAADDEKEEHLKELSKEKTYTVTKEDIGSKIVLKVTGLEDQGYTGTLKAVTGEVTEEAPAEDASRDDGTLAEQNTGDASGQDGENPAEEQNTGDSDTQGDNGDQGTSDAEDVNQNTGDADVQGDNGDQGASDAENADQNTGDTEGLGGILGNTDDTLNGDSQDEENAGESDGEAGSESVEGIPAATEDGSENTGSNDGQEDAGQNDPDGENSQPGETDQNVTGSDSENAESNEGSEENSGEAGSEAMGGIPAAKEDGDQGGETTSEENKNAEASAASEAGSDVVDFGTVSADAEDDSIKQYVQITNTGSETLNFEGNSPEHFAVEDIQEPLEPGASVSVWVVPRVGTEPGTYSDTITYTSVEGATASYTAKMVLTGDETGDPEQNDGTGNTDEENPNADQGQSGSQGQTGDSNQPGNDNQTGDTGNGDGQTGNDNQTGNGDGQTGNDNQTGNDGGQTGNDNQTGNDGGQTGNDDQGQAGTGGGESVQPGDGDQTGGEDNGTQGGATERELLKVDQAELEFTETTESKTVTIKNPTDAEATVKASVENDQVVVEPASSKILAGENVVFTVKPSEQAKLGEKIKDTITFSYGYNVAEGTELTQTLTVSVTLNLPAPEPEKKSNVTADASDAIFTNLIEGYTERPEAKTITLTNNGTADAALEVTSDKTEAEKAFDATLSNDGKVPANKGTATLSIQPKTGLKAGTYTETFTVTDESENTATQPITITATITINAVSHNLTVDKNSLDFASVKEGYGQIEAGQIKVTNNGNVTETLAQPAGSSFDVSKVEASALTLKPGETVSFTAAPKTGLKVGDYSETIKITAQSGAETSFTATFQVIKGTASVTKIQTPAAVTGIANGTKKDAKALNLPSAVVIETTKGNMNAAVAWDVKNANYDPSSTKEQTFTVKGSVSLPDGVDNNNKIDLSTSVKVTVKAYSPKLVSAENNYITGIKYNGVYTTQSKISFTAVGAGMDNDSPKSGDTRYVPMKWKVINTNIWNSAPYTASFGLAQSGAYTLTVTFRQQAYDGSMWRNQDNYDTKSVPFSISKAKVTAPGQNLTPAANRRKAVKTGDDTAIAPFVFILIVAAGAIGGVLVYRRKRK